MKSYKISMRKIESYQSISKVLAHYKKLIENVKGFSDCVEEFNDNISKLLKLQTLAAKDTSLTEDAKSKCRSILIEKTLPVITILKIFAFDQKKQRLTKKLEKFTSQKLQKCSDVELTNSIQDIWHMVNKFGGYSYTFEDKLKIKKIASNVRVVAKLEKNYGLDPTILKDLEEAFLSFTNAFYTYENELSEKISVIKKIKKNLERTEELIDSRLDLYVSLFDTKSPEFSKAYHNTRLTDKKMKQNKDTSEPSSMED
jgi:hypothetical protein